MKRNEGYCYLKIRKRSFYVWIIRGLWIVWLVFWAEVAVGSRMELEPRAFGISLGVFTVSLILGLFLWIRGNLKRKKKSL